MVAFSNKFFDDLLCKFDKCLVRIIMFLVPCMIVTKYKMYSFKKEIRSIENNIVNLSYNKDNLKTELNFLINPERLNNIYKELLHKKIIGDHIIVSHNRIKTIADFDNYYARKNKNNKKTSVASNGK